MKTKIITQKELDQLAHNKRVLEVLMKRGYTKEEAVAYAKWSATNHPISIKKRGAK